MRNPPFLRGWKNDGHQEASWNILPSRVLVVAGKGEKLLVYLTALINIRMQVNLRCLY